MPTSAAGSPRRIRTQGSPQAPIPVRPVPVFRDRDELAGASDLTAAIRAALEESAALLVACDLFPASGI